jgi:SAM-dependent methyltransferase
MALAAFLARQLGRPSGFWSAAILARLWNRRNRALNDMALQRLALQPHDRVLEVGFGGGYLLGRMATVLASGPGALHARLAGVDVSPAMVAYCARRYRTLVGDGRLDLRCAGADDLPFPPAHFDKACSVNSIFYWPDAPRSFAELRRVLAPGGRLVVCFTCRASLEKRRFARHGLTLYEAHEVQHMLEACGFRQVALSRGADRWREFMCASGEK